MAEIKVIAGMRFDWISRAVLALCIPIIGFKPRWASAIIDWVVRRSVYLEPVASDRQL